jgi:D-glycero-alpha-D-manno-heptose-7-phosphate kinase
MIVRSRAPLRLGLGGGGTDVAPYCDLYGGFVLNATISKYAYATIKTNNDGKLKFIAADQNKFTEYDVAANIPQGGILDLHVGVYNRIIKQFNHGKPIALTLATHSDAPPGSGLGSSSTLVVAMVKAFVELLNLPLGEYEIAHLAYEIERIDVGLNGGKQDQYAAAFGGFNFMEFYADDRVIVNPLRIKNWIICELEASLVLFYTGVSRSSALIIDEQTKNVTDKNKKSIDAMHAMRQEATIMKESILKGDFKQFAESLDASWKSKKQMAYNISNPHIEAVYELAKQAGAHAGKISGAGGGGFMMFYVDPSRRVEVIQALGQFEGKVFDCHFTKHGSQAWKI